MFLAQTTVRTTITVCVVLVLSFLFTGFVSSAYHRERSALGAAHLQDGRLLESHGDLEGAAEEYRKALLFSPDLADYRLSLAGALVSAGKLDEAQSHLDQLLEEYPTNSYINWLAARVAGKRHNVKGAIDLYQRAVYEYWPRSGFAARRQARWELIGLLTASGRRTEVIAELLQLYANLPPDPEQRLKVGFLLLDNGATSEAATVFQDLSRRLPQDGRVHRGLGEVHFNAGDYVSARHEFQRALRVLPSDAESAQKLELTNEIIDLDPAQSSIAAAERLRRSKNLLARVIKDLRQCADQSALPDPLKRRLAAAQSIVLQKRSKQEDPAFEAQNAAQQLWKDRAQFCGDSRADLVVELALQRLGINNGA